MTFQRITIIGTGLIGASLGLALKRQPKAPLVIGFDISAESRRNATRLRAVDRTAGNLVEAVRDAELVVIATPVRAVELVLREIAPFLPAGAVVTDTGSTKRTIVGWAREILPEQVSFVGGHPMTGRVTAGVTEASASLFEGTLYCLTPSARTDERALERVVRLVESLGAVPYFLEPDEHDALVAAISHLPYLLAASLMRSVATDRGWREASQLAAGGFATEVALAEGDPQVFADIALTNREHLVRHLDRLIGQLEEVRGLIAAGDELLLERLVEAQRLHHEWVRSREQPEGALPREELRRQSLFLPSGLGDLFRGKGDRGKGNG